MGVNSLPKTVTQQRRGCDLNPGPSAPEPSTLTTRLHWMIFMVLSVMAHSHCEMVHLMNVPGGRQFPDTKPVDLGCESAGRLLPSTTTKNHHRHQPET